MPQRCRVTHLTVFLVLFLLLLRVLVLLLLVHVLVLVVVLAHEGAVVVDVVEVSVAEHGGVAVAAQAWGNLEVERSFLARILCLSPLAFMVEEMGDEEDLKMDNRLRFYQNKKR